MLHALKNLHRSPVLAAAIVGAAVLATPQIVEAAISGTTTVSGYHHAYCPSGYKVSGGGFKLPSPYNGSSSSDAYFITSSGYSGTTAWVVEGYKVHGSKNSSTGVWTYTQSSYTPTAYAVCVK